MSNATITDAELHEVTGECGEMVALFVRGHVDRETFWRSVQWAYDPDLGTAASLANRITHEWWRTVPGRDERGRYWFVACDEFTPASFPVTCVDVQPWSREEPDW